MGQVIITQPASVQIGRICLRSVMTLKGTQDEYDAMKEQASIVKVVANTEAFKKRILNARIGEISSMEYEVSEHLSVSGEHFPNGVIPKNIRVGETFKISDVEVLAIGMAKSDRHLTSVLEEASMFLVKLTKPSTVHIELYPEFVQGKEKGDVIEASDFEECDGDCEKCAHHSSK